MLRGEVARILPAAKRRESPGKKGVIINPVSQKITTNSKMKVAEP
jgi:hypothetical protein